MILNADLSLESHCLSWVNEEEDQIDNIGMMGNPGHLSSAIQIVYFEISPDIVYIEKSLERSSQDNGKISQWEKLILSFLFS